MDKPRTTPKDFFLWAGAIISLYASIFAFLGLVFDYINYAFPNPLQSYYTDPYQSGISYEMASLIVMFPIFFMLMRFIHRDIAHDATRRDVWVRRWALVFTLFIAGITMAVDLIVLLTTFLSGETLTEPFLFKVVLVFLVSAGVCMHFIADLWGYWGEFPERLRRVGYGAILLALITIGAGFFIVGTPMQARQALLDSQKVTDLENIQSQIVYYWQQKGSLPGGLNQLNDSISNYSVPADSQSGQAYRYVVDGAHTFELCATFNRDSDGEPQPTSGYASVPMPAGSSNSTLSMGNNWQHGTGQVCFIRTIDPAFYPVK
ncbi:MAG TPA: DUF5671 domain-containing protein [Candidatus Paceibacterota bacterium]|jgi:hypothetical protein|nr:DUF5671 domain-containing protein [Candidatus Paceibacterota bacterium]